MTKRISPTLNLSTEGKVACAACGHGLCANGEPWKPHARLKERPLRDAAGAAYTNHPRIVLRQFVCPVCAALLDTEQALPEDPFLNDHVSV